MTIDTVTKALAEARKKDTQFIDLWLTDIQGNLKSISIPPGQFRATDDRSELLPRSFDGSSVMGMTDIANSDLMAYPDACRLMRFPFKSNNLVLFSGIRDWKGMAFYQGDWRYQLKTKLTRIHEDLKYQVKIAAELEFYLFLPNPDGSFNPSDAKGYFDLATISIEQELLAIIVTDAEQVGIRVNRAHHEGAKGQFEIELQAEEPLTMADNVIALRHIVRTRAKEQGLYASFMPKPMMAQEGCGLHLRLAVFHKNSDNNALYESDLKTLSIAGKSAVVGLCRYSRELMLATNQWVNSYKRFQPNTDAPNYLICSEHLRATSFHSGFSLDNDAYPVQPSIHVTHPDAACNPYLAFNALISAALTTQEPYTWFDDEFFEEKLLEDSKMPKHSHQKIPEDLGQAIEAFEKSELAVDIWGKVLCVALIKQKRKQWHNYQKQVSDWEIGHYREVL